MALTFDVKKIENYDENYPDQDGNWNIITFGVVHRMMHTGLGYELTHKNAAEFYARCKFADKVSGTILLGPDGENKPLTVEDIKGHIGLTTNVGKESRSSFVKRYTDWDFRTWLHEFDAAK